MEIGGINNTVQFQSVTKKAEQVIQSQGQTQAIAPDVLQRIKEQPEYRPTLQEATIIHAIEQANQKLLGGQRELQFSVHEKTNRIMIRVLDSSTNEVIREIPSEKILDMVANMMDVAGLLMDERR